MCRICYNYYFFSTKDYDCSDYHPICKKYKRNNPESCEPTHKSYPFMRKACMESCGRCNGEVGKYVTGYWRLHLFVYVYDIYLYISFRVFINTFLYQGCRDEFAQCEVWKNNDYCVKLPEFMQYNCRETCGTCGFLSRNL